MSGYQRYRLSKRPRIGLSSMRLTTKRRLPYAWIDDWRIDRTLPDGRTVVRITYHPDRVIWQPLTPIQLWLFSRLCRL